MLSHPYFLLQGRNFHLNSIPGVSERRQGLRALFRRGVVNREIVACDDPRNLLLRVTLPIKWKSRSKHSDSQRIKNSLPPLRAARQDWNSRSSADTRRYAQLFLQAFFEQQSKQESLRHYWESLFISNFEFRLRSRSAATTVLVRLETIAFPIVSFGSMRHVD